MAIDQYVEMIILCRGSPVAWQRAQHLEGAKRAKLVDLGLGESQRSPYCTIGDISPIYWC